MKLNRVIQNDGQDLNPAFMDSLNPSVSRRGFVTAAGMGCAAAIEAERLLAAESQ